MIDRKKVIEILWDWHYRVPGGTDEYDALMDAITLLREPEEKAEQRKQKKREWQKAYRESHKEQRLEAQREWRKKNPEKWHEQKKRWRKKHHDEIIAKQRVRRAVERNESEN